jgi:membrane protease YdiL (CAAX protease family)
VGLAYPALRREGRALVGLGLQRPYSVGRTVALGFAAAIAIMVAATWMLGLIAPMFESGPDIGRFEALQGSPWMLVAALVGAWTAAALGEEILVRGYMMGHLARWFGGTRGGWAAAAVSSSALFGVMHFYQGAAGMAITGIVGFMLAVVYLAVGRHLWVPIIAHGLIDTVSLVSVYLSPPPG